MPAPPRGEAAAGRMRAMRALLLLTLFAAPPGSVVGAEPLARITTDSQDYCVELADRLARLPGAHDEPARSLAADGLRLCDSGHARTGVAKLRRALRAARLGH